MLVISISLLTVSLFFAGAVTILFVEVVAATVRPRQSSVEMPATGISRRIAVLVPAHNESTALLPTLADIKKQLSPADQLLVVADNCTDDTAVVALGTGANVTCRNDPVRKGKGYALAWGFDYLRPEPPDVVVVIDADCRLADGAIIWLTELCMRTRRPVQALDLMIAPSGAPINLRVMEFAWRVKNWVRPLGLKSMGLPCQLMGTGMAFPWDVVRSVDLASGSIVEDLNLGLDLAVLKTPPLFCPSAVVMSEFPSTVEGVESQRMRWEKGHIGIILARTPGLILRALRQINVGLLALTLDASIPPLSVLGILLIAMVVIASLATLFGVSSTALLINTASFVGLLTALFICWLKFGLDLVPPGDLPAILSYVAKKIPLYCRMLFRNSDRQWVRTDRKKL
jgi:cellulose synthase/poly-beta-1,6-N-acetylglucosamine synthase-like glycosyltransferase